MKVAIVNLGEIVSGDWRKPFAEGDTILVDGETIALVGTASASATWQTTRTSRAGLLIFCRTNMPIRGAANFADRPACALPIFTRR